MEFSAVCRICLSSQAKKDISELKPQQNDHNSSADILLFCLSIQVNVDSNISNKLCIKCWKRLIDFYDFKLLALKNDAHLRTLEACTLVKSEPFRDEQFVEGLKTENLSTCSNDFVADSSLSHELKLEEVHYDYGYSEGSMSDNEFKKGEVEAITYEYIPEPTIKTKGPKQAGKNTRKDTESSICSECGESVEDLKGHLRRHGRQRDYNGKFPCSLCDKTFTTQKGRKKHKNRVHLELREPCPICNKKLKHLKDHMLTHNTADRPHSCDLCDKKFQQRKLLVAHKRRIHEKPTKTALCHICSKTFSCASVLVRHMRSHTNERPYKCKECGKAFNAISVLRAHENIHVGKLRCKCEVCDMKFLCKRYLTAHMLTHTREKRFSCHFCEWKFHRIDHARQHEVTVHKFQKKSSVST